MRKGKSSEKNKPNLIVCDCEKEELTEFRDGLLQAMQEPVRIKSYVSNWGRSSALRNGLRYVMYFLAPFLVFLRRKKYHTIIGWQQFYALIFCWYCALFHVRKSNTVCAVNFTYVPKSGGLGVLYRRFVKRIVTGPYLDCIHVPSYAYKEKCCRELDIPADKVLVAPFGVPDRYALCKDSAAEPGNYALALGRSNRDYDWLVSEWQGSPKQLLIISDTYKKALPENSNIALLNSVSGEAQFPYIAGCDYMILPLKDPDICSGDTVLLTAMSFEKTVFVTEPSTLSEMYLRDSVNGYGVRKEPGELRKKTEELDCGKRPPTGKQARQIFLSSFSRRAMGQTIGTFLNKF